MVVQIDVFDWDSDGTHDLIGITTTTATQLLKGELSLPVCTLIRRHGCSVLIFTQLINDKKKAKSSKYTNSGVLTCRKCVSALPLCLC